MPAGSRVWWLVARGGPVDGVGAAAMLATVDRSGNRVVDGAAMVDRTETMGDRAETRSRIRNPSPRETLPLFPLYQDNLALASRLRLTPASAASTANRR